MRILTVGLDATGKSTILYNLKIGEIVTTILTIGNCPTECQWHGSHDPESTKLLGSVAIALSNCSSCSTIGAIGIPQLLTKLLAGQLVPVNAAIRTL